MLNGERLRELVTLFVGNDSILRGLSPKTIQNKRLGLNRFLLWLENRPLNIDAVQGYVLYMIEKGKEPSGVRQEVKYIKAFVHWLVKKHHITKDQDFRDEIETPKVLKKEKHWISEQEAEQVIYAGTEPHKFDNQKTKLAKEAARNCLLFVLRHGLRISEALKLKGSDFYLDSETMYFMVTSKGRDRERMPIAKDMLPFVRQHLDDDPLFDVSEESCSEALKRGTQKLGLKIKTSCHDLRHIYTIGRLTRGEPLQKVSRTLRHADISVTDKYYSHYLIQHLEETLNNSPVIIAGIGGEALIERVVKAVDMTGVAQDHRATVNTLRTENKDDGTKKLIIEVIVKESLNPQA